MDDMNISYSKMKKGNLFMYHLRRILKWIFILGFIVCPIVNYFVGGPAWSVIVMVSIIFLWTTLLSPSVLEITSIGLVFRTGSFAIILTTLIGLLISPGWLGFVLPIIGFGILALSGILFFSNLHKHRNNIMPLIWEILIALVAFLVLFFKFDKLNWPTITMGSLAAIMAITGLIAFHKEIWRELRKRFHTK